MPDLVYGTPEDGVLYVGEPSGLFYDAINLPSHRLMEDYMSDEERAAFEIQQAQENH